MSSRSLLLLAIPFAASVAWGQGTGLAAAPAATTQKHKVLQFQYRQTSRDNTLDSRYRKNFQITYGLIPGVELSFDSDLDGEERFGGKYTFFKTEGFLATVGAFDALDDPELYVAGMFELENQSELHFGVIDKSEGQGFVGFRRKNLVPNLRFTADHITGPGGRTSFRGDYDFTDQWRATVRVYFPNETSSPRTHRFEVSYKVTLP